MRDSATSAGVTHPTCHSHPSPADPQNESGPEQTRHPRSRRQHPQIKRSFYESGSSEATQGSFNACDPGTTVGTATTKSSERDPSGEDCAGRPASFCDGAHRCHHRDHVGIHTLFDDYDVGMVSQHRCGLDVSTILTPRGLSLLTSVLHLGGISSCARY